MSELIRIGLNFLAYGSIDQEEFEKRMKESYQLGKKLAEICFEKTWAETFSK